MDKKYTLVEISDILPDFDIEKFSKYLSERKQPSAPKINTIDFLLNELSIAKDSIDDENVFIRNFIYAITIARKHLIEIDKCLNDIRLELKKVNDKESYQCRKLKYFEKKNITAKNEITDFICYGLVNYIGKRHSVFSDLIDRNNEDKMWLNGPTYDYNYNYKYYDPNYDFATFARFFEIPNVALLDFLKNIEDTITLKQTNLDAYYQKVKSTVNDNKMLSLMAERISNNYHFHKRKEIFESMVSLFEEKKYITFILTATIQIEGMFYDLVTIRYGKKENQGTLVEKADKTFNRNSVQKQTLYPHFAFDLPELRNQVAHNGLVDNANIENFAYELILDLNCIVSLAEKESLDKFKTVLMMFEKMNEVDSDDFTDYDAYIKSVSKCLLSELYMSNMMSNEYFWNLLSEPSNYEDELLFYLPINPDEDAIYLKDAVLAISSFIRKEEFWQVVLEESEHISEINHSQIYDFGAFVEKLKNMFIPRLDGKAKELCCEVNKKLQSIKKGK